MKHWVFDLDGTLVDSFSHFFNSVEKIFTRHGATFPLEMQHSVLTEPLTILFEKHLGKENVSSALDLLHELSNADAKQIVPFEGVLETLQELKNRNLRIGVWTNRDLVSASLILKHAGLEKHVEICVSGTCTTLRKPHPEGLLKIIKHFECAPHEVIMIGDHEHDMLAAQAIGSKGVRASWHGYWQMEPCKIAIHQFHDLNNFSEWIKKNV